MVHPPVLLVQYALVIYRDVSELSQGLCRIPHWRWATMDINNSHEQESWICSTHTDTWSTPKNNDRTVFCAHKHKACIRELVTRKCTRLVHVQQV